jgi:hypothetical protein
MNDIHNKLARLHNRRTAYELVAVNGDQRVLVCYSVERSRNAMFRACCKRGEALVALTGAERCTFAKRSADGLSMGAWSIRFSGRTQRECYIEGELPYIGNLVGAAV